MTSTSIRTTPARRSCPVSDLKLQSDLLIKINPEFERLSSKSDRLHFKKTEPLISTPEAYKELFLTTITNNFEANFPSFHSFCTKWILNQWKDARMNLQSRLTKISYLEPTLSFEPFSVIQKEIRVQWRKNHMLKGFTYIWTHLFLTQNFINLQAIKEYYNAFCKTFLTVSYALFQRCLQPLMEKGFAAKTRLQRQTAVALVTEIKQWRQIYETKICPFLHGSSFSENFSLQSIQANPKVLDVHTIKDVFQNTSASLKSLISSLTMVAITQKLQEFRNYLLKEMQESIESQRKDSKHLTVEKEDVLCCIIYTLVKHKLDGIGNLLEYLSFILGKDIDQVLRWSKVDCFRTDLEAAYWFVTQPVVKIDMDSDRLFNSLAY